MAERPGELNSSDRLDPVSRNAGAGNDEFLERYSEDDSDTALRGFDGDTDSDDSAEETQQIKAQIEETRSHLGETIDAIQDRLSIANIQEQVSETVSSAIESAKDSAYDATIGQAVKFMRNVGEGVTHSGAFKTVKKNPLPLALIGLGTGLLMYQNYGRKKSYGAYGGHSQDRRFYGQGEAGSFESGRSSAGTMPGGSSAGISDKATAALGSVKDTAGSAIDSVTGAVTNVYSGAGDIAKNAYSRVGDYGEVVQDKYDEYLRENPLALGALAVAVGAAVGFSIPSTRYEGKLMGEARENLMEKAHEAAGSLVDKAKQVASDAGQTVKEGAQALTQ
ncbi:MAG TPA: DUF3618 domain-containing protein [Pyrinomonadaceae bacterium]|nr:DUF3618 domain-containing protein [Pyrinomonadaceae bacterium]